MKINLLYDHPGGIRSGWLNVDPLAPSGRTDVVPCSLLALHELVDPASCAEVCACEVLPHLSRKEVPLALDHWVGLLARGGRITLSAVDLAEVCRLAWIGSLRLDEIADLLFGPQDRPWRYHRSAHHVHDLAEELSRRGLSIEKARIENRQAVVVARRG